MKNEDAIEILKSNIKYFNGKGRKYTANIPLFNAGPMIEAMRRAVKVMERTVEDDDMIEIVSAATATEKRVKRWVSQMGRCKHIDEETKDLIDVSKERMEILTPALKKARKVCNRINRSKK